jgi:hypothetical protein
MHIPRYWAQTYGNPPSGRPPRVDVWGWSDISDSDARHVAQRRLAEVIARAEAQGGLPQRDQYYPRVPLREPIITELTGDDGPIALITRNRYGADVLNTERVFVADVDVPQWEDREPGSGGGWLRRKVVPVDAVVQRVAPVLRQESDLAWRIYRTRAGLRVIATGADLPPSSPRAQALLTALGADPLYVQLTQTYDSYRARLSPKPWRIGIPTLQLMDREFARDGLVDDPRWLAEYDRAATGFAVCRLVETHGSALAPEDERIIALHDEVTGVATPDLPLA